MKLLISLLNNIVEMRIISGSGMGAAAVFERGDS